MNRIFRFKRLLRPASLVAVMAGMAMILAACAPAATAATTTTPTQTTSASAPLTIDVATDPSVGQYLVDNNGFTLYISKNDTADTSTCDAACQQNWPPLISSTIPKVGPGVDASLVGLANLSNGEKIVTYDKKPLYYKLTDKVAGQATGEDVNNVWFIVSPAGAPIEAPSFTAPISTPTSNPTSPAASSGASPSATPQAVTEPIINVAKDPNLGNILVGATGWTIYAYSLDTPDTSNCNAACQAIWMPVRTNGHPILGSGVDPSMIGFAMLGDGSEILTYNHMPLYYFVNEVAPGQSNGQGYDNVWFVVSSSGNMVGNVSEATINLASNPTLGSYLVDGRGIALYIYTNDPADTSTCAGTCATIWPPVLTLGNPILGPGVDQSMIGTAKLADGSLVVTYNHKPLYYFVGDGKPGQVLGQGFKQIWYVLGPDGQPITTALPSPTASAPEIKVATSPTLGQYLVNGAGMTLYAYSNDLPDRSNCTGTCLAKWPALLAQSTPSYGSGVDSAMVGSTGLPDNTLIVTYNHIPLYTYSGDSEAGDINGQGFGGLWYAVSPTGQIINK
jgi:predicted lipoprotein with Yx(FWY)xxD motif